MEWKATPVSSPKASGAEPEKTHSAPPSTEKFDRLKAILREMFQLDRGDLDFGLYRIMNLKAKEIEEVPRHRPVGRRCGRRWRGTPPARRPNWKKNWPRPVRRTRDLGCRSGSRAESRRVEATACRSQGGHCSGNRRLQPSRQFLCAALRRG